MLGSGVQSRPFEQQRRAPASAAVAMIAASASAGWASDTSGTPRLRDRRLFGGDLGQSVAEILLVVDADAGDPADQRAGR